MKETLRNFQSNFEICTCEVYVRRNNRKIFFIRFAYGFILSKDIGLHFVAIASFDPSNTFPFLKKLVLKDLIFVQHLFNRLYYRYD